MSRRTQLTTKYMFQVLAQLSENFIFIYLGLTLFTDTTLFFKPLFILITVVGICAARWAAVFPLSKAINWFIRYRAKRRGKDVADELPHSYQVMLFWAGLRGAVGVALAAGLTGPNGPALQATVLVVVVLTVIIFGGTTARMLEIMGIRTGVVEEIDSDDEFDIETASNGTYYKSAGNGLGHLPKKSAANIRATEGIDSVYSSGNNSRSPPVRPTSRNSTAGQKDREVAAQQAALLSREVTAHSDEEDVYSDSDLPPAARTRPPRRKPSPPTAAPAAAGSSTHPAPRVDDHPVTTDTHLSASAAIGQFFSGTADEHAAWFTQLDEGFIKPKLLLDQNRKGANGGSGHGTGV